MTAAKHLYSKVLVEYKYSTLVFCHHSESTIVWIWLYFF